MEFNLLYIDDKTDLLDALRYFVVDMFGDVATMDHTSSCAQALVLLQTARKKPYHAILFDLDFPDNNLGMVDFLRLRHKYPQLPVFLLSSSGYEYNTELKVQFMRNGAEALFDKVKLQPEEIIKIIFTTMKGLEIKPTLKKAQFQNAPEIPEIPFWMEEVTIKDERYHRVRFGFVLASVTTPTSTSENKYLQKKQIDFYDNVIDLMSHHDYQLYETHVKICNYPANSRDNQVKVILYFSAYFGNKHYLEKLTKNLIWDLHFFIHNSMGDLPEAFYFGAIQNEEELKSLCGERINTDYFQVRPEFTILEQSKPEQQLVFLPQMPVIRNSPDLLWKILAKTPFGVEIDLELRRLNLLPAETEKLKEFLDKKLKFTIEDIPAMELEMFTAAKDIYADGDTAFCVNITMGLEKNCPNRAIRSVVKYCCANERHCTFEEKPYHELNTFSSGASSKYSLFPFIYPKAKLPYVFWWPIPDYEPSNGLPYKSFSFNYVPHNLPVKGIQLGAKMNMYNNVPICITEKDLQQHLYIVGQTGTGKTTLLKTIYSSLLSLNQSVVIIDPHGDLANEMLQVIPEKRHKDIMFFDLSAKDCPKINLLEYDVEFPEQKQKLIDELFSFMNKEYDMSKVSGPAFEQSFKNALGVLFDPNVVKNNGMPMLEDLENFYFNEEFRRTMLRDCEDEKLKAFWETQRNVTGDWSHENFALYVMSKLNKLLNNPVVHSIISSKKSEFDFNSIIKEKKLLIVKLDLGQVGTESAALMGFFILNRILMCAMAQSVIKDENKRMPVNLIIDEFQNFTSPSFGKALSEVRKYKVRVIAANQTVFQLNPVILNGVLGNAGSRIFFRLGPMDYQTFSPYLSHSFSQNEIINLPNYSAIGQYLINGQACKPFVFNTVVEPKKEK